MPITVPRNLREAAGADGRADWLARLPAAVAALARRWDLDVGGPFEPGGSTAWVAPAASARFGDVVVKVGWRHDESADEAEGLRVWGGEGAVRVHAAEERDDTITLLLERCTPGTPLATQAEPDQDEVIARLLRRLWAVPVPTGRFRPLQTMCDEWADRFDRARTAGAAAVDAGLAREGVALFRSLPATADRSVLLCTDLHGGNVLAAQREPWLVIDPKPYVGDPAYDLTQHMLNCDDRLHADPIGLAARLADLAGLDRDRVRHWLFARCVQESPRWPGLDAVARRVAPV
jgi:streptomycin 6-kinase